MLKRILFIILLLVLFIQKGFVSASEIDSKMQKIVKQFIRSYDEKESDFESATVAVFPFQAAEKLSKKKVNVAVSEMLTLHLVESNNFKVIERSQLETILKEQSLGLSGAIASETAAQVGKLLGARLSVVGNVIKVGKYYQISAKLVDTETSEIISASISEVPIELFDEEASRYLVIVPEYQTIGLYAGVVYSPFIQTEDIAAETHFIYKITPTNPTILDMYFSCGLRYWAKPSWMIDIGAMIFNYSSKDFIDVTINDIPREDSTSSALTGAGLKITLNRSAKITDKLTGYLGAGYKTFAISVAEPEEAYVAHISNKSYSIKIDDGKTEYESYIIRTGVEYKLQSRFGWSLFANISSPKDFIVTAIILGEAGHDEMTILKYKYPAIHIETTFALYF